MSQDALQDSRDLGAFIPSALDDYGLDVYEFRIYSRIVRRAGKGNAWESVSSMAKACKMGEQKVKEVIRFLISAGMIERESRSGQTSLYKLLPQQKWVHPETLDLIRDNSSYHPGVKNTQVVKTPGMNNNLGVDDTQGVGVVNTQGVGVDDTHKGNPVKVIQEGNPNKSVADATCTQIEVEGVKSEASDLNQSNQENLDSSSKQDQSASLSSKEDSGTTQKDLGGDENSDRPKKKSRKKRPTVESVLAMMSDDKERHCFNEVYTWYSKMAARVDANPGDKALAGMAWIECEIYQQIDRFRDGCRLFQASHKKYGIPHLCNFIAGSKKHPTPYWLMELEIHEASKLTPEFIPVEASNSTSTPNPPPSSDYVNSDLFRKRQQGMEQRWRDTAIQLGKDPDEFVKEQQSRLSYAG